MKNKTLFSILFVSILSLFLLIPSSWAGSKQRHRWEGVAIGVGAAILGNAILSHHYYSPPRHARVYHFPPHRRHSDHWKYRKVRAPSTYKKVWNPGHYNRKGKWIPGGWITIKQKPNHWAKNRTRATRR